MQLDGKSSQRALDSPADIQVSVTQRKSNSFVIKKSFKIKVLLASDLAFTRATLTTSGSGAFSVEHEEEAAGCEGSPRTEPGDRGDDDSVALHPNLSVGRG